jgi:hypothetical protein
MKTLGTQVRPEAVEQRITTTWARSGTPRGAIRQIAVQDPFDPFPSVAESRSGADAACYKRHEWSQYLIWSVHND